jgi:L-alanine-DL-glutamate epimerase-like enolase superfamily enzyme
MPAKVTNVERITCVVPMVERIRGEMERADIHDWAVTEICRVETDADVVGYGETIVNYTWGKVSDESVERVIGHPPAEFMWDDSLGAGLQMALFDAAGKVAGVPLYRLLGHKERDWCAASFWDHDMGPKEYAREAKVASDLGYTSMKIKTRPWHDVYETMERISKATPDWFHIDCDWNDRLVDVSSAIPVLKELERDFPKISIWESPMKMGDASGNRLLRDQIDRAIAHHYGAVPIKTVIELGVCDGFVIGGGISKVMSDGKLSGQVHMPFFLQMVGTGLTTATALHLGAVLSHAWWPMVTCHELYEHNLLTKRLDVVGGAIRVPEEPGLGVDIDEDAIARYRVDEPDLTLPRSLTVVHRPMGVNIYFARGLHSLWPFYERVDAPLYERGAWTERVVDDGTAEFADLWKRAEQSPVISQD